MAGSYPTTRMCDGELLAMFEPTTRDSDVFISTSAKCGQTWLQSLLFHLKTGGREPDFRGVGLGGVSPWLELPNTMSFGSSWSTREERLAQFEALDDPRVFKLHVVWDEIPRPAGSPAKIMTVTRDPRDVPYSMFSHLMSMNLPEGEGPPDDFDLYFEQWMDFGFYYKFLQSFWPHKDDEDVLFLRFADMKRDLRGQIARILEFLAWEVSSEVIERIVPLVDINRMRETEKSTILTNQASWKNDRHFFREGAIGKNAARLSDDQRRRVIERLHAELPPDCCAFVTGTD